MKTHPTSWNLKLLYKGDNDPQIERDLKAIEQACASFEKKYKGKDFTSTPTKLKKCLDDLQELEKISNGQKPFWYFHLRQETDSLNKKVEARVNQYGQRLTNAFNKITFFRLVLGKLSPTYSTRLLKNPLLKEYKYQLEKIFSRAKYDLTEEAEQLASLLSQPGKSLWMDGQKKLLNSQSVKFKGEMLPLNKAVGMVPELPKQDRHMLYDEINKAVRSVSHFAESEINAVFNFKKIMDERRGYKEPYSATVLDYENDPKTVENLVKLISDNFKISHRFYKIHAKLLGERKLKVADRNVRVGNIDKKFDYDGSLKIIKKAFSKVGPWYEKTLESFVENGQLDVYPKKGKRAGAFCSGGGDNPTFILLNHVNDLRSLETIAHEMGHAFHTELSKTQPHHYREYSIAPAEVASTFFEQVVLDELENELDEKDYLTLLHNKIMGDVSTIFVQIGFFNFELELHRLIRKEGFVSKEEMTKLMSKHFRTYLGPVFEITEDDGYFFVRLPHLRYFFYVYSYAYGQIISKALFEKWKENPKYIEKIEEFFKAGGSMSPEDIFKKIGIDTSKPEFFRLGLKSIERDIDKLEQLTRRR